MSEEKQFFELPTIQFFKTGFLDREWDGMHASVELIADGQKFKKSYLYQGEDSYELNTALALQEVANMWVRKLSI